MTLQPHPAAAQEKNAFFGKKRAFLLTAPKKARNLIINETRNAKGETKMTKWNGSKWIRPEKRLAIYLRDGFRCVYCGRDLHRAAPEEINLDHIKPRSKGGSNESSNLVTSCKCCNSSRGDKALAKFADETTRRSIRRQTRRSLKKPLELAKNIISSRDAGWS